MSIHSSSQLFNYNGTEINVVLFTTGQFILYKKDDTLVGVIPNEYNINDIDTIQLIEHAVPDRIKNNPIVMFTFYDLGILLYGFYDKNIGNDSGYWINKPELIYPLKNIFIPISKIDKTINDLKQLDITKKLVEMIDEEISNSQVIFTKKYLFIGKDNNILIPIV